MLHASVVTATGEERMQQSAGAGLAKKVRNVAKKINDRGGSRFTDLLSEHPWESYNYARRPWKRSRSFSTSALPTLDVRMSRLMMLDSPLPGEKVLWRLTSLDHAS